MHAGPFHKFHNARHKHVPPVADRIHLDFLAADVFVDKDGLVRIDFGRRLQVFPE